MILERICLFCKYNPIVIMTLYIIGVCTFSTLLASVSVSLVILFDICSLFVYGIIGYFGEQYLSKRKVKILHKVRRPLNYD